MPTYEKIDGVWREIWSAHVKVDGVWRDIDISGKVNDQWKTSHEHFIKESDIVNFRLVYKLNPNRKHPLFPNLKTNINMPIEFSLTGDTSGINTSTKGVLFHYERFGDEEGILMYEGRLYAVLKNGCLVDVPSSKNTKVNNDDERVIGATPDTPEAWITNKMRLLTVKLQGRMVYESFRYHMYGWNSLFDTTDFLLQDPYTVDEPYRDIKRIEPRLILPIETQLSTFSNVASIGVARSLTTVENMIGAYGILDHTIDSITVDGVTKPFIIEICK